MNPDHVHWHRRLFDGLYEGGTWGVPRSGLFFGKKNGAMFLLYPPVLDEMQAWEYQMIKQHFEAAGIYCGMLGDDGEKS
jgi:hypothetical protein